MLYIKFVKQTQIIITTLSLNSIGSQIAYELNSKLDVDRKWMIIYNTIQYYFILL